MRPDVNQAQILTYLGRRSATQNVLLVGKNYDTGALQLIRQKQVEQLHFGNHDVVMVVTVDNEDHGVGVGKVRRPCVAHLLLPTQIPDLETQALVTDLFNVAPNGW
eukprot:CAMPEP_0204474756 /NCGR_PEP_ID=MMETSP0471-20130131/27322_1 /ASSEMBLY_ACC=CAM_ASM_000602 /TAXON_ID=2969 /ORGANISM="Oxyrrhis marina" /LENGTH=105 /DNA_ID=CAMNT_0051477165 /DNA_START=99 /DNA_END=413 /DNA_ORIENTATION=+